MLKQTYPEMMVATDAVLKQGLEHNFPAYRCAAALAIGNRNKQGFEEELLTLLTDPEDLVRQAARRSLVGLSKKTQDFGPLPGANRKQLAQAEGLWREWWKGKKSSK